MPKSGYTDPRVLEKQEQQQPTYLALSYINRFMTDAARREQETLKKKATPKLSLSITGGVSRNSVATPPRHSNGNLTPPVTPPITPSSSFRSSTPTGAWVMSHEDSGKENELVLLWKWTRASFRPLIPLGRELFYPGWKQTYSQAPVSSQVNISIAGQHFTTT
ncbi:juxtaposed with another zinc finger protein 1-like [Salvelinus namaycush]|uniref:Juxtaposed with another zinc finger protein 1-like n=1 Tax=Salvelinus namaycush TaxID=8040 RepID=A0A8U1FBI7_SALNM|nr:juxtaposed with another zinc finger protein 1-like [Salvelinus namaycush]